MIFNLPKRDILYKLKYDYIDTGRFLSPRTIPAGSIFHITTYRVGSSTQLFSLSFIRKYNKDTPLSTGIKSAFLNLNVQQMESIDFEIVGPK